MDEPVYSVLAERLYARLPDVYRTSDEALDYVLKRWLSGVGDQAGVVDTLIQRFDWRSLDEGGEPGETSDLVDPAVADDPWLDWLGQLVGVELPAGLTPVERRDAVVGASSGFRAGTKAGLAAAAASVLTGTRYAVVYDHSTGADNGIGAGTQWDVLIVTRESETPPGADVISAIVRKQAKPAGIVLHRRAYSATWAVLEAQRATWTLWDGATWTQIEETGL